MLINFITRELFILPIKNEQLINQLGIIPIEIYNPSF
jgi:hypothetical protein